MKHQHINSIIWAIAAIIIVYILAEKFKNIRFFVAQDGNAFGVEATEKFERMPETAAVSDRVIGGK